MNLPERDAVKQFLEVDTPLKRGLVAFLEAEKLRLRADCASYMASVPRDTERASDRAAMAEAYDVFMANLEYFAKH